MGKSLSFIIHWGLKLLFFFPVPLVDFGYFEAQLFGQSLLVFLTPFLFLCELLFEVLYFPLVHSLAGLFAEDTGMGVDELKGYYLHDLLGDGLHFADPLGLLLDVKIHVGLWLF
jgi:hypothetical protein